LWQNILKEIDELDKEKDSLEREIDYLSFVVEELTKACVKVGDEEYLSGIRTKLQNRDKEIQLIQDLMDQLGSHELDNIISKSLRIINRSGKETGDFQAISKNLDDAYNHIEEARSSLRAIANSFNDSEHNLDSIEEKLFEIRDLARKYAVKPDQLPEHLTATSLQLAALQQRVVSGEKLIS
jgi:DNA repair protein RecN (Recombination protein N)